MINATEDKAAAPKRPATDARLPDRTSTTINNKQAKNEATCQTLVSDLINQIRIGNKIGDKDASGFNSVSNGVFCHGSKCKIK